jgi:protease PrsW
VTSTQTLADLDRARDAAIDLSGWGRKFTFRQPRNLAYWGYSVLVIFGALAFLGWFGTEANAYAAAIDLAVISFAIYAALFWWFTRHIDRYAKLPFKLMVVAFLWGAFGATWALAINANDAINGLYAKAFGQVWALDWGAGLDAPFIEETAKGAGLLLLIALAPRLVRTAFDGFILGAFIGLGFQIVEDILYAVQAASSQFGPVAQLGASVLTILIRMVAGIASHTLYSAIFCAGLIYLLGRPAEPRRVGRGLLFIAIPILLHGIWDSLAVIGGSSGLLTLLLLIAEPIIALIIVVRVYALTVGRERDIIRVVMAPEAARNVVTGAEIDAMAGNFWARWKYRTSTLPQERRRARYVLNAAHALAEELAAARGADTDAVRFARAEVARIRAGIPLPPR